MCEAVAVARSAAREGQQIDVDSALGERLARHGSPVLDGALASRLKEPARSAEDIWANLVTLVDPAEFRPKLADDVEIKDFHLRWGNDYSVIANPRALTYFNLDPDTAQLARHMDGTKTIGELVVGRLDEDGDLNAGDLVSMVSALHQGGFLDPQPADVDAALERRLHPVVGVRARFRRFAKTLRVDWKRADGLIRAGYPLVRWCFTPVGVVALLVIGSAGVAGFVSLEASGRYHFSAHTAPVDTLAIMAMGFVLTFSHEFAHAATLVHYGRRVKSAGFMIYFGSTAFFIDASDGLMMDRAPRIYQAAAGPLAELALAGVSTLVLVAFPNVGASSLLYKFAVLNYFVIFENLVPFLELDGYWILSDLIQVPDLRPRSLEFIQHDVWHKLRHRERFSRQEVGLLLYSVLGVAFTVLSVVAAVYFWRNIFGGLLSTLWRSGIGGQLLLLLLAFFFVGPAIRGLLKLVRSIYLRARSVWRSIVFRLETSWRVEAAELIDALPLFEDLPVDALNELAGRVRLRTLRPAQPVFRQGDRANAFYVVRQGRLRVEEEHPETGDTRTLRTLERGDSFGELGLLEAAPRAATVRAETDAELFEVGKSTFDHLLADSAKAPKLAPTLHALVELRELRAFVHLGTRELAELLDHGSWSTAAPGDEVVRQGDVGDAFYAIRSGQADVVRDGEVISRLGPGDYFGEIALLRDVPRTASVVARTPLRAFRLERSGFDRIIADAFVRGALQPAAGRTWEH